VVPAFGRRLKNVPENLKKSDATPSAAGPLVSIITPIYNGEEYLSVCIESVLAQTYQNWDYTILDNCSKDKSLEIALRYAARDSRIRVIQADTFLPAIQNHNRTVREISPSAKYCKFLFADDWLYPRCVEEMVRVAERNPAVGLVGAFGIDGQMVFPALPNQLVGPEPAANRKGDGGQVYAPEHLPGKEIARSKLLGGVYVFGTMTTVMVRADLVRKRNPFFNEHNLHSDHETLVDVLQESDFGFVHQVLSFSRPRPQSLGSFASKFNSILLGDVVILLKYGPVFLQPAELQKRWKEINWEYHSSLAHNVLRMRSGKFWKYHRDTLAGYGAKINVGLLATCALVDLGRNLAHPVRGFRRAWNWWSEAK
jgi:glycosyltransferase involved in cell wall biosynthesis